MKPQETANGPDAAEIIRKTLIAQRALLFIKIRAIDMVLNAYGKDFPGRSSLATKSRTENWTE